MTKAPRPTRLRPELFASSAAGVVPCPSRLLLLAGDPWMRRLIACPLEAGGYEVTAVADEEELLATLLAMEGFPDLVICDARESPDLVQRLGGVEWAGRPLRLLFLLPAGGSEATALVTEVGARAIYGNACQALDLSSAIEVALEEASTVEVQAGRGR